MRLEQLKKIVFSLSDQIISYPWEFEEKAGLYNGTCGMALHYALLHKYTGISKYEDQAYKLITDSLNNLNSLRQKTSLSGISGVAWALQYLVNIDFFDYSEASRYITKLKMLIIETLDTDISHKNFDLMHGMIGKMITLMEMYDFAPHQHNDLLILIENSVKFLKDISIQDKSIDSLYWMSRFDDKKVITGLAHGVSSIVWYLSKLVGKRLLNSQTESWCTSMIKKAANWLINCQMENREGELCIPTHISDMNCDQEFSLAWCHGDLGIAIALIRAGAALKDARLFSRGQKIAENIATVKIQDSTIIQQGKIVDVSLCHGVSGAFFHFFLLYKITGSSKIKIAYEYWLEQMYQVIDNSQELSGLQNGRVSKSGVIWEKNPGLLFGLTGNVLILLTYILVQEGAYIKHDWFKIFI